MCHNFSEKFPHVGFLLTHTTNCRFVGPVFLVTRMELVKGTNTKGLESLTFPT